MKRIKIILGLVVLASVSTFAQSPRIKLNQITKDTVKGSVLISSPTDSGMVYSRDFYVAYGADTVLILYGDTLGGVGGGFASVLSDGVTITGNGTSGNELKVDTLLIATIKALNDSLATISASTTPDGVTITGDGSVGNPLKVDTATVISTIQGLVDTLTNRGYLTANQTITISGDVTGSGTTSIEATVVDDSHNHIISNVDFLQDSLNAKANDSDLANYVTIAGADTITGAKTFSNSITQSGGNVIFNLGTNQFALGDDNDNLIFGQDGGGSYLQRIGSNDAKSATRFQVLYNNNYVGFRISNSDGFEYFDGASGFPTDNKFVIKKTSGNVAIGTSSTSERLNVAGNIAQTSTSHTVFTNNIGIVSSGAPLSIASGSANLIFKTGGGNTERMRITSAGNVGIGEINPSQKLDVNGKVKIQDLTGTGGNAVYENGGVLGVASDARFKTYVGDIQNGIALINQLKPKYFIDNRNSSFQQLGFYAQEVKSVINEASYPIGNTDYLGINDRAILATSVKAIQEQQAIIETQASEINQLKTLITDLTNRLIILENK